jgi:hypothetical protein
MSDIFISYAREDQSRAKMLAQIFEARGWSIFWDRTIPIGKTWRETIGGELEDARCVIVLWSRTSIKSGWVQDEADDAKRRGVLVPILIENVQPPMGFRSIQAAHLENWDGTQPTPAFRRLIADIAAIIGSPPEETEKAGGQPEPEIERKGEEEPFGYLAPSFGLSPFAEGKAGRKAEKERKQQLARQEPEAGAQAAGPQVDEARAQVEASPLNKRLQRRYLPQWLNPGVALAIAFGITLLVGFYVQFARYVQYSTDTQRNLSVGNTQVERNLSVDDPQAAQGNLENALMSYRQRLVIAERLAKSDPANTDLQRDLSASYQKVGDVLVQLGRPEEALPLYLSSIDITERLAKSDLGDAGLQHDLSVLYQKVGDARSQTRR